MITCDPDYSVLTEKVSNLQGALLGRGASDGELQKFLRVETGQLAWEIAQSLGPLSKEAAGDKLDKDLRKVFTVKPQYSIFEDTDRQGYSSTADFTWLTAGKNFLIGINDEDDLRGASQDEALELYKSARGLAARGLAYVPLGTRGKQKVMRVNRVLVTAARLSSIKKSVADRFGQMKASFARTTAEYAPAKRIPAWVARSIATVIFTGKSILNDQSAAGVASGYIEFGSRAPGVVSNDRVQVKIQGAIVRRTEVIKAKFEKVLNGYAYDWNTGQVFRSRENDYIEN